MIIRTFIIAIALLQWTALFLRLSGYIETTNWVVAWFHPLFATVLVLWVWSFFSPTVSWERIKRQDELFDEKTGSGWYAKRHLLSWRLERRLYSNAFGSGFQWHCFNGKIVNFFTRSSAEKTAKILSEISKSRYFNGLRP